MERFSLFEGLKGLHAVNLTSGKTHLPKVGSRQKGIVGSALKTRDHLYYDLVSKDLWLDVAMQLIDVRLNLHFEVKVQNRAYIIDLVGMLASIANVFLDSNEIELKYEDEDVKLDRRITDPGKEIRLVNSLQDEAASAGVEMLVMPLLYHEDTKVEDLFHFLERRISCQFLKEREVVEKLSREGTHESTPFLVMCDAVAVQTDLSRLRAFPIRNFRKEALLVPSSTFELQAEEHAESEGLRRVCCCCLC